MRTTLTIVLVFWHLVAFSQVTKVHYQPPAEELEAIKQYNLALLNLALEKTKADYGAYEVVFKETQLAQRDALRMLNESNDILVVPTMSDRNRERVFHPVRVPLFKGLFGIRLMMINQNNASSLNTLTTIEQLKGQTFCQGFDWPDTQILKAGGLNVKEYSDKDLMINAVATNQVSFYPRSVAEIWDEIAQHKELPLEVQNAVYLYYPTPVYFFLRKNDQGLAVAKRIETGLNRAIDDGSFDKLFNQYMMPVIEKAGLAGKKPIKLNNPLLPDNTPKAAKYWYVN